MWTQWVKPAKDCNMNLVSLNPSNKISCHVLKQSGVAVRTFSILICEVCSDVALRQTYGEAESASNNLGRFLAIVRLVRALWGIRESNRGISLSLKSHTNRQDIKTQCFGTNVPIYVPCGTYRNILRLLAVLMFLHPHPRVLPCVHRHSENMLVHAAETCGNWNTHVLCTSSLQRAQTHRTLDL